MSLLRLEKQCSKRWQRKLQGKWAAVRWDSLRRYSAQIADAAARVLNAPHRRGTETKTSFRAEQRGMIRWNGWIWRVVEVTAVVLFFDQCK